MKKITTILTLSLLMLMGIAYGQTHLWGTCEFGGTTGQGIIFKADNNGNNLTTVYEFDNTNGARPLGNMVLAPNGKIYGVTDYGGCLDSCVIYEYDPVTNTNLDVFDFYCNYGHTEPADGMILGTDGNLYGFTPQGGAGYGYIYRFNPNTHVLDTIYNFRTPTGAAPYGRPLEINNKLYGTTEYFGAHSGGVIFSFNLSTFTYSDLHDFDGTDGSYPYYGSLLLGNDGKLYGTTYNGGTNSRGVIFSYDTATSIFSVVYDFDTAHGCYPYGSLMQATDGKLYGMAGNGGLNNDGVIYSFNLSDSVYTDLYDFDGPHGSNPKRELMQAGNGLLFGTTMNGGGYGDGVLFSYNITTNTYTVLQNFNVGINGYNPLCDIIELPDNLTTGIKSITNIEEISVFPNPASTILNIHQSTPSPNQQLIITDLLGNEVYTETLPSIVNCQLSIVNFKAGLYFYEVRGMEGSTRGKFFVQK
jgi:uncharacterized repeat protein (TIGR03803 family)